MRNRYIGGGVQYPPNHFSYSLSLSNYSFVIVSFSISDLSIGGSFLSIIIYLLSCHSWSLIEVSEVLRWYHPRWPMIDYCFVGFQPPSSSLSIMAILRTSSSLTSCSPSEYNSFSTLIINPNFGINAYYFRFYVYSLDCWKSFIENEAFVLSQNLFLPLGFMKIL